MTSLGGPGSVNCAAGVVPRVAVGTSLDFAATGTPPIDLITIGPNAMAATRRAKTLAPTQTSRRSVDLCGQTDALTPPNVRDTGSGVMASVPRTVMGGRSVTAGAVAVAVASSITGPTVFCSCFSTRAKSLASAYR